MMLLCRSLRLRNGQVTDTPVGGGFLFGARLLSASVRFRGYSQAVNAHFAKQEIVQEKQAFFRDSGGRFSLVCNSNLCIVFSLLDWLPVTTLAGIQRHEYGLYRD